MPLTTDHRDNNFYFLDGGGEMGALTRDYDWSKTILGEPNNWPQSLRIIVSIVLTSRFPMFLWWGSELICFYNDAYRPSLGKVGKHPSILGMPAKQAWPEIWDTIEPLINQVLTGGEATWSEDQLIPIYRNGRMEDVYWTFSYSPAKNEFGKPEGVLVTCTETTQKVAALKALSGSQESIKNIISQAPVAIAIFRGPEFVIELANEKVLEYWGRTIGQVLNIPLFTALPEASGQGFEELLTNVMRTGEAFIANELPVTLLRHGILETTWINFIYDPLREINGEITGIMVVCSEVTEQVNARFELEKTTTTLTQAIESASIGTWGADLVTRVLTLSERTRYIHGVPEDIDLTLEESFAMIVPEDRERVAKVINNAVVTGEGFSEEYLIEPMDGSTKRWIKATGKVKFEKDVPKSISGTLIDITEQKLDDQRKSDFIGMVSHELKTPLTSLTALVQTLMMKLKGDTDSFVPGALEKANNQVKKMSNMINGFLNISRLESGKIHIDKQIFDLNELVEEVIDEMELTVSSHDFHFSSYQPIQVYADRDKIGSVISNLISNAVKYSPKQQLVDIKSDFSNGMATISIRDEGIGIKQEDISKLFDRYYRVNNNTTYVSGFGIGLYLSVEIIQRHDGKIWVESEIGKGSTFFFSLPINV